MELKHKTMIEIPFSDFREMIISSLRYCFSRKTYMLIIGKELLEKYWIILPNETKQIIINDLEFQLSSIIDREHQGFLLYVLSWCEDNFNRENQKDNLNCQLLVDSHLNKTKESL